MLIPEEVEQLAKETNFSGYQIQELDKEYSDKERGLRLADYSLSHRNRELVEIAAIDSGNRQAWSAFVPNQIKVMEGDSSTNLGYLSEQVQQSIRKWGGKMNFERSIEFYHEIFPQDAGIKLYKYAFKVSGRDEETAISFSNFIVIADKIRHRPDNTEDKLKVAFALQDQDNDGIITEKETTEAVRALQMYIGEVECETDFTPENIARKMFEMVEEDDVPKMNVDQFVKGCLETMKSLFPLKPNMRTPLYNIGTL